jgi:hypothetical protein
MQSVVNIPYLSDTTLAADFNKDGKLDLAIADYGGDDVLILLGNGDGTFPPPPPTP